VIPAGICCQFVNKGLTPTSYIYLLFWHCTQRWARCINTWVYVCMYVHQYFDTGVFPVLIADKKGLDNFPKINK
jgi:hypothetical protein